MRTFMKFNAYDAVPEYTHFLTLEEFRAFIQTGLTGSVIAPPEEFMDTVLAEAAAASKTR
jgi:hypothetical protein